MDKHMYTHKCMALLMIKMSTRNAETNQVNPFQKSQTIPAPEETQLGTNSRICMQNLAYQENMSLS